MIVFIILILIIMFMLMSCCIVASRSDEIFYKESVERLEKGIERNTKQNK